VGEAGPERLGAFSDGVIAVIITIMVLDLKAPRDASLGALLALWPMFLSYGLSYLFVGIVWVNHHHLLRYAKRAEPFVIWTNLLLLFFVSLIPFFTAYMAENRMDRFTAAVYAAVFLCVTLAFMLFQEAVTRQTAQEDAALRVKIGAARKRNWLALGAYAAAIPAAYVHPAISLALIFAVAMLYFVPEASLRE
jgi:TMEM175 potassium channel family protein